MNRLLIILTALVSVSAPRLGAEFVHPGLLHSRQDLERMRVAVAANDRPITDGFELLAKQPTANPDYKLRGPHEAPGRLPDIHSGETRSDAQAAYHNALMWAITGEQAHARKAMEILNAWSSRHKRITGIDGILLAGLQGIKFANAAEILRYTGAGWPEAEVKRCERWFQEAWLPTINNYGTFANCNWDVAALQTKMAIAIFCGDHEMFEETVRYAVDGGGNGSITHTVVYPSGQAQETTRRQHYAQLGLGLLANVAEMAWTQGVDLYGWADNRLLRGMEYNAAYGLGEDVPYQHYLDRTGKYGFGGRHQHYDEISPVSRGNFTPIFEQPYQHYVKRRGASAPFMARVVRKKRPEGCSGDQVGLGTLTHWQPAVDREKPLRVPGAPAGLVSHPIPEGLRISWVPSVDPLSSLPATGYQVLRAPRRGGPYADLGFVREGHRFETRDHQRGRVYYYVVKARNEIGLSGGSVPFAACAGLPVPWTNKDIGAVQVPGYTISNGTTFRLEGEGKTIGGKSDQFQFAYAPLTGDGTITARIAFPPSSGWAQLGVMMRESLEPDASFAAALLLPPKWRAGLVARAHAAREATIVSEQKLGPPHVIKENRLMMPYWVRLTRKENNFSAFSSRDGTNWDRHGSVEVAMKETVFVGLPACSQLPRVTTTVTYDRVRIQAGHALR